MSQEDISRIEVKIDGHIERHDSDYKKLLWWVIATLIGLMGTAATGFITVGTITEKVSRLEEEQKGKVSQEQLDGYLKLFDERFRNINDKLDDIKQGLNIK